MLEWLRAQLSLSAAQWELYAARFTRLEVPARTLLLRENEIAKRAYFIEQGCVRVWFTSQAPDCSLRAARRRALLPPALPTQAGCLRAVRTPPPPVSERCPFRRPSPWRIGA
jgi:hypothetical protein